MKNLFKSLMLVAVAAMTFTACQNDNGEMDMLVKKTVIEFTAGFDADTRSHFGDKVGDSYPSFWEGGEQVAFVAPAADYEGTYTAYAEAVKIDDEGKSATFTVVFNNPIKAGTVKAYLGAGWNTLEDYAYVDSYYAQTPRANSVDPMFHLASTSFEYDGASMDFAGKFKHGVAYGKMTVKGFEGKKISEVTIELIENEGEGMYPISKRYRLNTAELDTHTYWFAAEACKAQEFTVSVVVDGVSYSKNVTLTAEKPLNFNVGRVSTFSVSNLAKDPVQLDMPIINASFADGKVTATWEAIENAVAYTVEVDGEVVEEAYKTTTYTFDAEYNTQYQIAVTAKAAENSAEYLDSYKGNTYFTTPMDISMDTDYAVVLKSYTVNGSKYRFVGADANDWLEIPFNPSIAGELPAGSYTGVYGNWSFSTTAALEYNWYDTSFNLAARPADSLYWNGSAGLVVVERENNSFKVTAIVSAYIGGYNKTVKYVYEESYSEPVTLDGKITKWTYTNTVSPTKYLVEGNGFSFYVGMNRNNVDFIAQRDGGYSLGDSSWYMKHFSIHDISIPSLGDNLNVTAGRLDVREGGKAGAIHDIDITLTINGSEYEFTYYGYINGEAVEGGGGSEPEPELPSHLDIKLTSMSAGAQLSSYGIYEFKFVGENTEFTLGWSDKVAAEKSIENKTYSLYDLSYSYVGNSTDCFAQKDVTSVFKGVDYKIASGTVAVSNNGDIYTFVMTFTLENDTTVNAKYVGKIGTLSSEPENPGEGGGVTPTPDPEPEIKVWVFTASLSGSDTEKTITMTGNDDTIVTARLTCTWGKVGHGSYYLNEPGVNNADNVTVNGEAIATENTSGTITIDYNSDQVIVDMTINGTKYVGTSTNKLFE